MLTIDEINIIRDKMNTNFEFQHRKSLSTMITFVQDAIMLAANIEGDFEYGKSFKVFLEKNTEESKSNVTQVYSVPEIYISLLKRMPVGVGTGANNDMFKGGNVISGSPKFEISYLDEDGSISGEPDSTIKRSRMAHDNEFLIRLKTKTLIEQINLVNLLERCFNVYCKYLPKDKYNYSVAGVHRIERKAETDNERLLTVDVIIQIRSVEIVDIVEGLILRLIQINYAGGEPSYHSGQVSEDGSVWEENDEKMRSINDMEKF